MTIIASSSSHERIDGNCTAFGKDKNSRGSFRQGDLHKLLLRRVQHAQPEALARWYRRRPMDQSPWR
jgi:hypothetical protein